MSTVTLHAFGANCVLTEIKRKLGKQPANKIEIVWTVQAFEHNKIMFGFSQNVS